MANREQQHMKREDQHDHQRTKSPRAAVIAARSWRDKPSTALTWSSSDG